MKKFYKKHVCKYFTIYNILIFFSKILTNLSEIVELNFINIDCRCYRLCKQQDSLSKNWKRTRNHSQDIKNRKMKYIAHNIRENDIFMLMIQEKIQGKTSRERKRSEQMTTNSPPIHPATS